MGLRENPVTLLALGCPCTSCVETFRLLSDHMLGAHVALPALKLQTAALRPGRRCSLMSSSYARLRIGLFVMKILMLELCH